MPIRPEMRHLYPPDWDAFSLAKKEAAGWRCECRGECARGSDHLDGADGRCVNRHGMPAFRTGSNVVLTTAHLNHDPTDCSDENTRAFCNGCHLHYDRGHHAETRAATRRARLAEAGQLNLLETP